jgi:hypothetical protein
MRARRTGDPHATRKPGPKPSPLLEAHRAEARLAKAFRLLGISDENHQLNERKEVMIKPPRKSRRQQFTDRARKDPEWAGATIERLINTIAARAPRKPKK